MFFFFGVLRRVGPRQVSPIIFGFKKTSSGKKNHTTFLGLLEGISEQKKMKDFDLSSCATRLSILVDIHSLGDVTPDDSQRRFFSATQRCNVGTVL